MHFAYVRGFPSKIKKKKSALKKYGVYNLKRRFTEFDTVEIIAAFKYELMLMIFLHGLTQIKYEDSLPAVDTSLLRG